MSGQTITMMIPEGLYKRLAQRADERDRSIADEVLEAVAMALPLVDTPPENITVSMAIRDVLDDEHFQQINSLL